MKRRIIRLSAVLALLTTLFTVTACAAPGISLSINGVDDPKTTADSLQLLFIITLLAIAPTIVIMMTGFTRILIVLSFIRNALGLQQTPPNQVLIGLALFLTLFLMSPVIDEIKTQAYTPYVNGQITQQQAITEAMKPMKSFMLKQTRNEDLNLFLKLSNQERPASIEEIPTQTVIPAFITSELRRAFIIGFLIYLPFIVIDMVVASVLMSMGMVMLPPIMISLPFKILLFVLVDGWGLVVKTLIMSFNF